MENDLDILLNMTKLSLMELDDLHRHSNEIDEALSDLEEYLRGVLGIIDELIQRDVEDYTTMKLTEIYDGLTDILK